jgi:hypothetical protein
MFGSSSTTRSRASAGAPDSVIDVFMVTIFTRLAEGNLYVSSGTAVAFQRTPDITQPTGEVTSGKREIESHNDPERVPLTPCPPMAWLAPLAPLAPLARLAPLALRAAG